MSRFIPNHFILNINRSDGNPQSSKSVPLLWIARGGAIALLMLLTACGTDTSETPGDPDPASPNASPNASANAGALKIGSLLPLTGDLAQYGAPMQDSVGFLVETVNACGGALGQPVTLISEDDQTELAAGASGMTKLAEVDQVAGVIGAAASSVSSVAIDIAVRNEVIQISPSSTSPTFTERANNGDFKGFWFRTAPPDTYQGEALAKLAQEQGFQKVAILSINNDYGNGLIQAFVPAFKALGGTITNESDPTRYAPDATTFDSEVGAAFEGEPDAVLLIAYPETGSLIVKAAYEQGLLDGSTKLLMTDGMKTENLAELVGQGSDGQFIAAGVIGTAPSAGGPAIAQFKQIYTSEFDREPQVYDPNSWDAAAILVLAAEAAKANTGAVVREQISAVSNPPGEQVTDVCQALELVREGQDIDFQGASGTLDFNAAGDVAGAYDVWTIAEDGKLEVRSTITIGGAQ